MFSIIKICELVKKTGTNLFVPVDHGGLLIEWILDKIKPLIT